MKMSVVAILVLFLTLSENKISLKTPSFRFYDYVVLLHSLPLYPITVVAEND